MSHKVGHPEPVAYGGNGNSGSNAGFFYANSSNAPSSSNTNYGSRHCLGDSSMSITPYRMAASPLGGKYNFDK